jgi:hypothetical protein
MKQHILLVLLCFSGSHLAAQQQLYPLRVSTDSLRFKVIAQGNRLALDWLDQPAGNPRKSDWMTINSLRLDDADLVMDYKPDKTRKGFLLAVGLQLRPDQTGETYLPTPGETDDRELPESKQITLLDGTERFLEYGQTYTLFVRKSLMGPVPCDKPRPAFTLAKQMPYYGAALAGGGLVGLGLYFNQQKTGLYNRYREDWETGEILTTEITQRLKDAKLKKKQANIAAWSGVAILALNGWLYTKKWFNIRQKQKIYDEFCTGRSTELGFVPVLGQGVGGSTTAGLGAVLRF